VENYKWVPILIHPFNCVESLVGFSGAGTFTLSTVTISTRPLRLCAGEREEIEALGRADIDDALLSFNATIKLIQLVWNHVSLTVS